jgi:hypothetical protein
MGPTHLMAYRNGNPRSDRFGGEQCGEQVADAVNEWIDKLNIHKRTRSSSVSGTNVTVPGVEHSIGRS